MKFKYTPSFALDTQGRFTKRPMLKLELKTIDGEKLNLSGLIDSGADQTMVNISYAKKLGIDLSEATPRTMGGIGEGGLQTFLSTFPINCPDLGQEIIVPACYIDSDNVDILIGQEGFFDAFKIKFEKDHDTFEIIKSKK